MVLLTEKDLSARWNTSPRTLRAMRAKRQGPPTCQVVKGKVQYRLSDIEAHEAAQAKGGAIPPEALAAMRRAASMLDMIARWKIKDEARAAVTQVRDELRGLTDPKE